MLAWHVDYWDYLGWKDPFARKEHSDRQRRYAKSWNAKGLVTPQIVVGNRASRGAVVASAVEEESVKPASLALEAEARLRRGEAPEGQIAPARVDVTVKLRRIDADLALPERAGVVVLLVRRTATTKCPAGENAGATLKEFFIVVDSLPPIRTADALKAEGARVHIAPPAGLAPDDMAVAILLEDPDAMKTLECRAFPVAGGADPAKPR